MKYIIVRYNGIMADEVGMYKGYQTAEAAYADLVMLADKEREAGNLYILFKVDGENYKFDNTEIIWRQYT